MIDLENYKPKITLLFKALNSFETAQEALEQLLTDEFLIIGSEDLRHRLKLVLSEIEDEIECEIEDQMFNLIDVHSKEGIVPND